MREKTAKEAIQLSDHFTYKKLIRFVASPIIMMVFTSIYGIVDGLFVSNMVGKYAFVALNFVYPFIMILGGTGFMIGTGGSALVAKELGRGNKEKADRYFTMMIIVTVILGAVITPIGMFAVRPVAKLFGATEAFLEDSVLYGRIVIGFTTAFMLQNVFQSFLTVAEKPKLGLLITVIAGVTNAILDALFMAVFKWGLVGAAVATGIGQLVGGIIPIVYFCGKKEKLIKLVKTKLEIRPILQAMTNGSSELMSNISMSIVGMLYNAQLIKYAGENGVAAYGTIMYVQFIFNAIYIGYAIGSAPIISYHYGAENKAELKSMLKRSVTLIGAASLVLTATAIAAASPLSKIFVGYDKELLEVTVHGMRIFAVSFLLSGLNIFASSFFTALNNGLISAIISFMRTLVFQTAAVLFLPYALGLDGIWWAITIAESSAFVMSLGFVFGKRKKYGYM